MPKVTSRPARAAGIPRRIEAWNSLGIGDSMIGRHDEKQLPGILLRRNECRQCGRGRGVAALRFEHDGGVPADLQQLFGDQVAVGLVTDDDAVPTRTWHPIHAQGGCLQHRVRAPERKELLRVHGAGCGPEPGAGSPRRG